MRKWIFLTITGLFITLHCLAQHLSVGRILIYNAHIVDVEKGTLKKADAILINGRMIEAVGNHSELRLAQGIKQLIDVNGGYIVPGLWDMHIHLEGLDLVPDNEALLPVFLAYGITTVRDCASNLGEQVLQWRDEVNSGKRIGPTIYTAGRKLEGKNSIWERDLEIATEGELRDSLDWLDKQRVDFIKITENTLSGTLFLSAVKASRARGYMVSGHVPYDLRIADLTESGFSSIEHASYLLRLGTDERGIADSVLRKLKTKTEADRDYLLRFDQELAIKGYEELAKKGIFVCPTLVGSRQLAYLENNNHAADKFNQYLTERFLSKYAWRINRMSGETPEQKSQRKDRYELVARQIPLLQKAGVRIIAGSDAAALNTYVYPAESLIEEILIFSKMGMKPSDILKSATINGAIFFGKEQTAGSIEAGKWADLLLLSTNPLEDISGIQSPVSVMHQGVYYDRKQLDGFLSGAAEEKLRLDQQRSKKIEREK